MNLWTTTISWLVRSYTSKKTLTFQYFNYITRFPQYKYTCVDKSRKYNSIKLNVTNIFDGLNGGNELDLKVNQNNFPIYFLSYLPEMATQDKYKYVKDSNNMLLVLWVILPSCSTHYHFRILPYIAAVSFIASHIYFVVRGIY